MKPSAKAVDNMETLPFQDWLAYTGCPKDSAQAQSQLLASQIYEVGMIEWLLGRPTLTMREQTILLSYLDILMPDDGPNVSLARKQRQWLDTLIQKLATRKQ